MAQSKIAMQNLSFQPLVSALDRIAGLCALAVLLIGLLVLAGWALKIEALTSVLPGLTSMKPNTALAFVLAGIALAQRQRSGLRLACAAALIALGGLSLAQDVTGADFGTDQLLFRDTPGAAQTVHPGRMSPITAIGIIVLGGALALLGTRRAVLRRTLEVMALVALALALIALIGYAYNTKAVFPLPGFGSMALLTPPALALLALGILCACADGLAGAFASAGLGGQIARRFLPLAIIAPVLLGGLVQLGAGAGLFDATQGTAVFAAAMVLVLVALSWRNALSLEASDAERQQAEEAQARLAMIVETSDDAILSKSIHGIIQTWNAGAERMFGYPAEEVVGKSITLLIPPERLPEEEQILQQLRRGEAIDHYETLRLTRDGRKICVSLTTSPLKNAGGNVVGASTIIRNITERKQADTALRASEAFSRSIIKSSPDCIKVLDLEGNLLSMQSGQELLGIEDIQPFLNKSWLDFWTSEDRPAAQAAVEAAAAGGAGSFVGFFRTLRGEAKWWDVVISPILDANGKPARLLAVSRDVTQRQQAQQALRESEERYRNLFNSMDEGFCIIDMLFDEHDKPVDYRFLEVNPAFEKQTGMHGVTGKRVREIIPDLEEKWFELYGEVARTGTPVRFINEVSALNRWFDIHAARLGGPETRQVAVIFDNITERKKAEEALRESEQRFRAFFDIGPVAIYSCDAAGITQEFNACAVQLWGREPKRGDSSERFSGSYRFYLPDGTLVPRAQSPMAAVLRGDIVGVFDQEFIIERPDGSRICIIANAVPLKNEHGQIRGGMCCFYDITERSRLEHKTLEQAQALTELDRRKDEFLAMLGHELRNPLAALANTVQLLRLNQRVDASIKHGHSIIERQVKQLTHLVDDLLEVSRITTGSLRLRMQQVNLRTVVERALETAQPMMTEQRHALSVKFPQHAIYLHADGARLEQVLINLLSNAAKYTEKGGRISLTLEEEGSNVAIRVRDNGIGIAPDLLPHIFELFTQAERSLDRSQGGLGIGLSLVQRLVELHGGSVVAHSELGRGSEFVVRLPLSQTAVPSVHAPLAELGTSQSVGLEIIVVDDNVDAAESLALLLEMSGHAVRLAYDGPSALQAVIAHRSHVVLLDIGLPGLDGFEVALRIRRQSALDGVTLVALTGYGQDSDRQRALDVGFDYHLVKPADFREIEKILVAVQETVLAGALRGLSA